MRLIDIFKIFFLHCIPKLLKNMELYVVAMGAYLLMMIFLVIYEAISSNK